MRQQELQFHYSQYYEYQNLTDEAAQLKVNQLLPEIQKNDQQAFHTALRIIREKAYFNICRKVAGGKLDTLDFVDDIIQFASMEYAKKSIDGFADIGHENFYAYSLKFFSLCTTHYISRYYKRILSKEAQLDDEEEKQRNLTAFGEEDDPERVFFDRQQEGYKRECIALYIHSIEESKIVPYQLITYCYTAVLTIILKDHRNIPELLKWINRLNRPGQEPSSWADEKTGEIGGRISRNSSYLLKWAIDAMYKKNVAYLTDEFVEIYNIRPLAGHLFSWGAEYCSNLKKMNYSEGQQTPKRIEELIITDEFQEVVMKNWMPRISRKLMKEVISEIIRNPKLKNFAVEYAEQKIAKKKYAEFC